MRVLRSIGKAVAEMKCPVRGTQVNGLSSHRPREVRRQSGSSPPGRYGSVKVLLDGEANPGVRLRVKIEVNTDEVPPALALTQQDLDQDHSDELRYRARKTWTHNSVSTALSPSMKHTVLRDALNQSLFMAASLSPTRAFLLSGS